MKRLNSFIAGDFIFSPRYRIWRHVIYWSFHIMIWAAFGLSWAHQLLMDVNYLI